MKRIVLILVLVLIVFSTKQAFSACPSMDFTGDCKVDFKDFAVFASQWLDEKFDDLGMLASQWLDEGIPEDPCNMVWVDINDLGVFGHEGFNGEMSKYETTNAQYCQFLNDALASGDITVEADIVYGVNGSNGGTDFVDQVYYNLAGAGYTYNEATNGGAARINYIDSSFTVDSGFENHPVTYVSWYGATAFCNYYGYRLPTEWQWQAVADYNGSFTYGCGTTINNSIANYFNSTHPNGTTAVGSFGTFGYDMCDMAGNVYEWTDSWYSDNQNYRIFRGCCWYSLENYCTVSSRTYYGPNSAYYVIGFRVCR